MFMNNRAIFIFLLLVLTQALHSVEEYYGRLWEVFAPAIFLSNMVSSNPERGFLIINICLFIFGLLCWIYMASRNRLSPGVIWLWVVLETINGIGHIIWSINEGFYMPGLATAPILLLFALLLAGFLLKTIPFNQVK